MKMGFKRFGTQCQKGISLLEVMLSLSIIAIILVMATRYFFVASDSQKVSQLKGQVAALLTGATLWKHNEPSYAGLTVPVLVTDNYLTKTANMSVDASGNVTKINNPWGKELKLVVPATNDDATIETDAKTAAACKSLKSAFPAGGCTGTPATEFKVSVNG